MSTSAGSARHHAGNTDAADAVIEARQIAQVLEGLRVAFAYDIRARVLIEDRDDLPRIPIRGRFVPGSNFVVFDEIADGHTVSDQLVKVGGILVRFDDSCRF